jgi:glutamyl/glutaminyl-tRNA synthetase
VHADGTRLAKRRGDLALSHLRDTGADPRAVVAWAARTSGHDLGTRCRAADVVETFRLSSLPRSAPRLADGELAAIGASRA